MGHRGKKKYAGIAVCPDCGLVIAATAEGIMRNHAGLSRKVGKACWSRDRQGRLIERGVLGQPPPLERPAEPIPASPRTTAPGFGGRYGVRPLDY